MTVRAGTEYRRVFQLMLQANFVKITLRYAVSVLVLEMRTGTFCFHEITEGSAIIICELIMYLLLPRQGGYRRCLSVCLSVCLVNVTRYRHSFFIIYRVYILFFFSVY